MYFGITLRNFTNMFLIGLRRLQLGGLQGMLGMIQGSMGFWMKLPKIMSWNLGLQGFVILSCAGALSRWC